ncbi:MAG: hypothetical protein GC164_13370 [Phycisphaera sp.]|nr:hypothetical protein [Phycisphaera sp.]
MRLIIALVLVFSPGVILAQTIEQTGPTPEQVIAGFEQRVDAYFKAEAGKPLVRQAKQGLYVRGYSYSIVAFAARCFYLNEKVDEANAALIENAQFYLDHPEAIGGGANFHWHADIVMRLIEMYGPHGTRHAGLLTPETEAFVLKPIWLYAKEYSWLDKAEYEKSKTWRIYGSENHDAMDFTLNWHFAKLAKDRPEYKDLKYDKGGTAAEHYRAWNDFFVMYCLERARKSPCAEMHSDSYNSILMRVMYNFYDFGEPRVHQAAGMLLDLYFAYWAETQIDGLMGGGGARIKGPNIYSQKRTSGNAPMAWFYFGIGKQPPMSGYEVNAVLSDYRPPAVVADIALDAKGRGRYEIRQRPQGLKLSVIKKPYKVTALRTDGGGILLYSYCDPAFIIGTPMTEARPWSDWSAISMQSRWQGVVFAGEGDPRIVPIVRPANNLVDSNGQWSVQSKGTLITQKLETNIGAAEMMAWFSKRGLPQPVVEGDSAFVEAPGAYAAVRVTRGGFKLEEKTFAGKLEAGPDFTTPPGYVLTPDDEYAPLILEVMAKTDIESFEAFKSKVKSSKISFEGPVLRYTSIYGDELTLDTSYKQTPTINGKPVDYAPKKVFDSPFLNADYNSGVVTISKGDRKKVLDFNQPLNTK